MPWHLTARRSKMLLGLVALSLIVAGVGVWVWTSQQSVGERLADVDGVTEVGVGDKSEFLPDAPPPNQVLLPRSVGPETLARAYAEIEEIREESKEKVQTFVGPIYIPSGYADGVDRLAHIVTAILEVDDVVDAQIFPGSEEIGVDLPDADSAADMLPIALQIVRTLEIAGIPEHIEGHPGGFLALLGADPEAAEEAHPPALQVGVEEPATAGRLLRQLAQGLERSGGHLKEVLLLNRDEASVVVRWERPSEAKRGARTLEKAFDAGLDLEVHVERR